MSKINKKTVPIIALCLMLFLSFNANAAQQTIVLTNTTPDCLVSSGMNAKIYGTAGANHVTIQAGGKAELVNFSGANTVTVQSDSDLFTVSRSGSTVTFQGSDGTFLKIPSTTTVQNIIFNDVAKTLVTQVRLGDQAIELTPAAIAGGGGNQSEQTFTNTLGMKFNLIPAGTFTMGSPEDELGHNSWGDETQHKVTLSKSYYIQTTEITQGQWKKVMGSTNNPSYFSSCGDNCPVETVSWDDIQTFITKLNGMGQGTYTLPTEAQWEYAARAGSTTAFANGAITQAGSGYDANLDAIGWYYYNSGNKTHSVAGKSPNNWGLYDMHGNVWEWCNDWYGSYSTVAATDPVGPGSGSDRVIRGGGWDNNAGNCRSAVRYFINPSSRLSDLGFRLVCCAGHQ